MGLEIEEKPLWKYVKNPGISLSTNDTKKFVVKFLFKIFCLNWFVISVYRDHNPEVWTRLNFLMDHDAERRQEELYWQMFQV